MVATTAVSLSGATGHRLRTILVVEDEPAIRSCTSEFLRDCSFVVIEAGDAAEARELLLSRHVDLVFSDVNLPNRETGFGLEQWIRHHRPDVKVLLTSGYPLYPANPRNPLEPLIPKPYSFSALLRRIDSAFEPATT